MYATISNIEYVGGYMLFHWWVGVPGEIRRGRLSFRSHVTPERRKMVPPFDFFVRVCVCVRVCVWLKNPWQLRTPLISGAWQEDTRLNPAEKRMTREPLEACLPLDQGGPCFPFRNYEFLSILHPVCLSVCVGVLVSTRHWEGEEASLC